MADLDQLTLAELREHRSRLRARGDDLSCWRRRLQARIDLLRAGDQAGPAPHDEEENGPGHDPRPAADIDALAGLVGLHLAGEVPRPGVADDLATLTALEGQIALHRMSLDAELDRATAELISRYRRDPAMVLADR